MFKNPRALRILQNVDYSETGEFTQNHLEIKPGSYIIQEDSSLVLENDENTSNSISGTPANIIISNDGSLRKLSTSSVSILADSVQITPTSEIADFSLRPDIIYDPQEALINESIFHTTEDEIKIIIEQPDNIRPSSAVSSKHIIVGQDNETNHKDNIVDLPSKKRHKKSQPEDWSVNKNKKQREKGEVYLGKKKIDNKWIFIEPKTKRNMKERCNCKLSLKGNTKLQCDKISEEERRRGFEKFWNMSWKEKKVYIKMLSICKPKQRERCAGTSSRRENSVELYLSDSKGNRYRVCRKMFLNSLCLGEWAIKKWIIRGATPANTPIPKNSLKSKPKEQLRKFFESLPKLESHYCRKDSSKLYLEPLWTSKSQLYKAYKDDFCKLEKSKPLSIASFHKVFDELNLSLFRPKKDLCETCESFKTGNVTESDFRIHDEKKKEARKELEKDTASNNEVLTMDLQSVLLCPRSNVSALYYRTKLIVHNFTMYDVKRNKGYCYIWNESEGKLTSNEFSTTIVTALQKFMSEHPLRDGQELILYSDGCTYQNRNSVLANALLNFSMQNKITVIQKYLEKGHTQMECDSMHSVIERAIRHRKINVPADYAYLAKIACKKQPYVVQYLYHDFFKDIEHALSFYKSIRPGKKAGDPTVTNLRALKYVPEGKIVYKLRHSNTVWEEFPVRMKKISFIPWDDIPQLYSSRLKIKKDKYMDLQALKSSMEKDYHKYYDELPHF